MDTVIDAPATSSQAVENETTENISQVDSEVSTASPGAQAENSPPAKTELDEFKETVAKATGKEPIKAESETKAEETAPKTDEPEAEVEAEEKDPDALSQDKQGEKVHEKFTDRPEWQAATKIADKLGKAAGVEMRGILRGIAKREQDLTQAIEKAKPAQEVVQEIFQSVGGSEQGFRNMRHLIKSFDGDPTNAVPMLETLLTDARKRAGLVLQSPELLTEAQTLDKQVEDRLIDQESADKRKAELLELQKARNGTERTQALTQKQQQEKQLAEQTQKHQAAVNEIQTAAESWEKEKLAKDPDYLPLKSLHMSRCVQLADQKVNELGGRMLTGKEARTVADEALKQVKEEVSKLIPKRTAKVPVSGGNGSSSQHRQQPTTEFEEFQATVEAAKKRN